VNAKPNLVIGLICAAGTDLTDTKQQLRAQLAVVGYKYHEIKVSAAIAEALELETVEDQYERTLALMDGGDLIRKHSNEGSGVASLIVTALRAAKGESTDDCSTAYVIDSLKNPKELEVLDQLYGRNFYAIAVYSDREDRRLFLANKIARSRKEALEQQHFEIADKLISRDQKGEDETGQDVRDTYPRADVFVDGGHDLADLQRFVRLIFKDPFITPTLDEYMMFVAKATGLRSCDLSRQVGAVIADKLGTIVATGCNEVPYPRGGFYFEGRDDGIPDNRDKEEQHDPNFNEVKRSVAEFVGILQSVGYIDEDSDVNAMAEALLHGTHKKDMENARFRNLIEFSRVVHAEMHAITQAAMVGRSVREGTLYCTTFPCHLCARHIISAGIKSVVFIEPYPKSLTESLYHREILTEPAEGEGETTDKVLFRSFRGISPTLYQRVFAFRKRKDSYGAIAKWDPEEALPVGAASKAVRPEFEAFVANQIALTLDLIHNRKAKTDGQGNQKGDDDGEVTAEGTDSA
jgi:deoxycytidylate deaminase